MHAAHEHTEMCGRIGTWGAFGCDAKRKAEKCRQQLEQTPNERITAHSISLPFTVKREYETHVGHLDVLLCGLERGLALEDRTAVLVELEGDNDDVGRVNADGRGRAVGLVPLNAVDVDDPLLAVHLRDLALTTLVLAPDNPNLVVLADRKCASL